MRASMIVAKLSPQVDKQEEKAQFVRTLFNRIAPTYDKLNDWISLGQHRYWKQATCKALNLQPGDTALDVCTGTGDLVKYLQRRVGPEGKVVGLDFSREMLGIARQRYAKEANCEWLQGDALRLPFEDNTFDGATIAFGLRNVVDKTLAVAEMRRVIKPGTRVVCLETNPKPNLPGFWLYFKYVMPLLGQWLANDRQAYEYLQQSTENFLTPEALLEVFKQSGLTQVESRPLSLGACTLTIGQK